ncbi:ComF family protein [uncultured Roseibium sp.]|uniref:ComF family protein n=1 Tax=uncultured Roseibium sp. TaxID=1936171 RepID=UPI002639D596|nr:ComF family protein [uncultured Roseibium sp.]
MREQLRNVPAKAAGFALDFLLPLRCISCGLRVATKNSLCADCWQAMPFIDKPWCHRFGSPFSYDVGEMAWSPRAIANPPVFERLRAAALYEGPARDLVLAFKFSKRRELAEPLARWMARNGQEFLSPDSVIVPVPLHWLRLVSRRFNQSADLAKEIAAGCGGAFEPEMLKRRKRTRQQVGLSAEERRMNVRSAFAVDPRRETQLQGRHVVLIDDVMTTGSTISACSKTLLSAGAHSVDVLTFALADPSLRT